MARNPKPNPGKIQCTESSKGKESHGHKELLNGQTESPERLLSGPMTWKAMQPYERRTTSSSEEKEENAPTIIITRVVVIRYAAVYKLHLASTPRVMSSS